MAKYTGAVMRLKHTALVGQTNRDRTKTMQGRKYFGKELV